MAVEADYLARISSLAAGQDPLAVQTSTPDCIAELIAGIPDAELSCRPQSGKWSVVEIIAHLAEDELVTSWRYRQMLEHPGCTLACFDQDKWASFGHYHEWNPGDALALFRLLRDANLRMLRCLKAEQWQCFGYHPERGRITVGDLASHMAGHDANHLEQIREITGRLRASSGQYQPRS